MPTDLLTLREAAQKVIEQSPVRERLRDVTVEADRDNEGSDFLRILVQMRALEQTGDAELEELVLAIEDALIPLDERFPSVRFADAA